jgi:hypothetical protein
MNRRLLLALLAKEQAASIAQHELNRSHVLVGGAADICTATPATLEEIFRFDVYFNTICRQNNEDKVRTTRGLLWNGARTPN